MKKRTKSLLAAFCTMALCGCLIAGSTYALFTDTATVNIAVTSGKVDVKASMSDLKGYSLNASTKDTEGVVEYTNLGNFSGYYKETTLTTTDTEATTNTSAKSEVTFTNGGMATLSGDTLTLDRITPGDKVTFNISVTNYSNVATKYRIKLYYDSSDSKDNDGASLFRSLKISVPINEKLDDDTTTTTSYLKDSDTNVQSMTTPWIDLNAVANNATSEDIIAKNTETANVTVELPITIGNEAQDKTCAIKYVVEAVQSNASVSSYSDAQIEYVTQTVKTTYSEEDLVDNALPIKVNNAIPNQSYDETDTTSTQSKFIPVNVSLPESTISSAQSVSVTVAEDKNAASTITTLDAGSTIYSFDVTAVDQSGNSLAKIEDSSYYTISFTVGENKDLVVYHKDTQLYLRGGNEQGTEYYTYDNGVITIYTKSFSPFVVSYMYGGGDGTSADKAYLISTVSQLQGLASKVNAGTNYSNTYFKLTNDLDLSSVENWTPIGHITYAKDSEGNILKDSSDKNIVLENYPFSGYFDGQNFTIKNLTSYHPELERVALFGYFSGNDFGSVQIKNIILDNAKITGGSSVGGVVGNMTNVTMDNVKVTNSTIIGTSWVGGIVGYSYGNITGCKVENSTIKSQTYWNGTRYDDGDKAGGIVGYCTTWYYAYSQSLGALQDKPTDDTVSISDSDRIGVKNCQVTNVTVEGYRDVGGLIGCLNKDRNVPVVYKNTITNCTIRLNSSNADTTHSSQNYSAVVGRLNDSSYSNSLIENKDENTTYEIYIAPSSTYFKLPTTIIDGTRIYGDSEKVDECVIDLTSGYTLSASNVTFENITFNISADTEKVVNLTGTNTNFNNCKVIYGYEIIELTKSNISDYFTISNSI